MTGDFDKASSAARLLSVVAIAASMGVVLLLASATWGLAYPNGLGAPTVALTVRDLPHWFEASLLVLSGVAVAGGIVATILPRRYLFLSALADLAMLAVVAVILVEWNRSHSAHGRRGTGSREPSSPLP